MSGQKIIREILLQSRDEPHGRNNGWIVIRVPSLSERDLSLYIKEANQQDLLNATRVTTMESPHDEWNVLDITARGLQFLDETKPSRKARVALWTGLVALVAFLGWLIPVLISILKH